jgi:polyisoprenoid-binding protein YceI
MFKHIKMKKISLIALITLISAACSQETVETTEAQEVAVGGQSWTVDVVNSQIEWYGHKPFVENYGHQGTLAVIEGNIGVADGKVVSGRFILDMNSIECSDTELPQEKKDYLVGHLKGEDFFDVGLHPTASFEITSIDQPKSGSGQASIAGNLTLKGITKNIVFDAHVEVTDSKVVLSAPSFKIDRKEWGITYKSSGITSLAKDELIADDLGISFEVQAKP